MKDSEYKVVENNKNEQVNETVGQMVDNKLNGTRQTLTSIEEEKLKKKRKDKDPFYFPHKPVGKIGAVLNGVFGSLLTLGFGIPVFVLAITGGAPGLIFGLSMPLLVGLGMDFSAYRLTRRLMRYKRYMNLFKGRSFCFVDELADFSNLDEEYVLKDLQKMLYRGAFPHAHIAEENKLILLTRNSYDQYILEQRKRKMLKDELVDSQEGTLALTENNETIKEGREFIGQVNAANVNIKDNEVSEKVNRLEEVITHIINYIEKHPEQKGNVRRFISYYLPSTVKLLNTYSDLEKHTIQGENIRVAKEEIKDSLDTINSAFEKLFNNLFAGISIDVSTDISVLETLLTEEGLTKEEFDVN